jgi:hypothetical protein
MPLRLAALFLALVCFIGHIVSDGWRPTVPETRGASRPSFLGLGLVFFIISEMFR